MILKNIDHQKKRLERNLYISYRYIKHYSPWVIMLLALLLTGTIIQKNYLNKPTTTNVVNKEVITSSNEKEATQRNPINKKPVQVKKVTKNTELDLLIKQLSAEKAKSNKLAQKLNNQEQQLVSALDNINQSYTNSLNDNAIVEKKSLATHTTLLNKSDYYEKVKAALSNTPEKTNNLNTIQKLSTTKSEKINEISSNEG